MELVPSNNRSRILVISFLVLFFGGGVLTHFFSEDVLIRAIESLPVTCPLRKYTGLLCSFCGMTHAWIYFWHDDWGKAFTENKLSIPLFIGAPFVAVSFITTKFWSERRIKTALIASAVILVIYSIARNTI